MWSHSHGAGTLTPRGMPAGTGSHPTENMTSGADVLAFLLIDTVSNTYAVWLKVVHDFRDAIIHMMDHVAYLLTQRENLEMADSSLHSFLLFFFLFQSNGQLHYGL